MKRLLVVTLALSLGGCASLGSIGESVLNLPSGVLTASVQNPVTPYALYEVEQGLIVAVTGLNVYKRNCWASVPAGTAAPCKRTVRTLQGYTRQLRPLIVQAKAFVSNNDQVNAKVVYVEIMKLVAGFRATATQAGVQ